MTQRRGDRHHAWIHLDVEKLVKDYNEGMSVESLAYLNSCAIRTIISRLDAAGVKRRQPKLMRFPESLGDEYTNGATLAKLAGKYGCATTTIVNELIRVGVQRRPRGGNRTGRKARRPR